MSIDLTKNVKETSYEVCIECPDLVMDTYGSCTESKCVDCALKCKLHIDIESSFNPIEKP